MKVIDNIKNAIKNNAGSGDGVNKPKPAFIFSFEFDVVKYPSTVVGKKNIDVEADDESTALDHAAEILNSELEDDQHLRYTQKFTKRENK